MGDKPTAKSDTVKRDKGLLSDQLAELLKRQADAAKLNEQSAWFLKELARAQEAEGFKSFMDGAREGLIPFDTSTKVGTGGWSPNSEPVKYLVPPKFPLRYAKGLQALPEDKPYVGPPNVFDQSLDDYLTRRRANDTQKLNELDDLLFGAPTEEQAAELKSELKDTLDSFGKTAIRQAELAKKRAEKIAGRNKQMGTVNPYPMVDAADIPGYHIKMDNDLIAQGLGLHDPSKIVLIERKSTDLKSCK